MRIFQYSRMELNFHSWHFHIKVSNGCALFMLRKIFVSHFVNNLHNMIKSNTWNIPTQLYNVKSVLYFFSKGVRCRSFKENFKLKKSMDKFHEVQGNIEKY
jgi:hypothetical protein